jgi:heme-degrading monooxygenase HmoA
MHARVTRVRGDSMQLQAATRWFRHELIPRLQAMPGYRDTMLLIDSDHGESLAITMWESAEAMARSEEAAEELRREGSGVFSGAVASVERFEVAVQPAAFSASG